MEDLLVTRANDDIFLCKKAIKDSYHLALMPSNTICLYACIITALKIHPLQVLLVWRRLMQPFPPLTHWGRHKNGRHSTGDMMKSILLDFISCILIKIRWNVLPSNLQLNIIDSDNGLAPIRRQAIIWSIKGLACYITRPQLVNIWDLNKIIHGRLFQLEYNE